MKKEKAIVLSPNYPSYGWKDKVKKAMQRRGPPILRAVFLPERGVWQALEGSHRLAAAQELGLPVGIKPVKMTDKMSTSWHGKNVPVCELVQEINSWNEKATYNTEIFVHKGKLGRWPKAPGWKRGK